MAPTVRELIDEIRTDLVNKPPADALTVSEYIVRLTALLGNIYEEIVVREQEYLVSYNAIVDESPTLAAEKVKMRAMATSSYADLQRAKFQSEVCLQMIQGLKYRSKALAQEWGESKNL